MSGESRKLTRFQRRWCELVNRGVNGTDAARQLGIKDPTAKQKAWKLRHMPHIEAYLAQLDANAINQAEVTRTFVIAELKVVAATETPEQYSSKVGALRELATIIGLKKEQIEISGTLVRLIDMTGAKTDKDPESDA